MQWAKQLYPATYMEELYKRYMICAFVPKKLLVYVKD